MKKISILLIVILLAGCDYSKDRIFIEAESFSDYGGWVNDAQFIDQMGSPYLMAHGLGTPVQDAVTSFDVEEAGDYYIYVRTYNWIAPFGQDDVPGRYQIVIDGNTIGQDFGDAPEKWGWVSGGQLPLEEGQHSLALHDLTGFNGRVDAIFLSKEEYPELPDNPRKLFLLRTKTGGYPTMR